MSTDGFQTFQLLQEILLSVYISWGMIQYSINEMLQHGILIILEGKAKCRRYRKNQKFGFFGAGQYTVHRQAGDLCLLTGDLLHSVKTVCDISHQDHLISLSLHSCSLYSTVDRLRNSQIYSWKTWSCYFAAKCG